MTNRTETYPAVVSAALAMASGEPEDTCKIETLDLEADLGIDSLTLLELVVQLEERLGITVSDEDTGQLRTVADIMRTVERLTTGRPERTPS